MKKATVLFAMAAALAAIAATPANSGLKVGEMVSAFHPQHVSGPHKGTDACPPCTDGNRPQVQVWVNADDAANVTEIARLLNENTISKKGAKLKTFVIFLTDPSKTKETAKMIEGVAAKTQFNDVCMAYLPKNNEAVGAYKVSTDASVKNTVFVYRDRTVQSKFVNLKADKAGLGELQSAINGITK